MNSENAIPNPKNHPTGVFVVRTMLEILSVTRGERVPGTDNGMNDALRASHCRPRRVLLCDLRVRVAHGPEVARARLRLQLVEQAVVPVAGLQLRDAALGVVDVAEHDRLRRAGRLAGGHHVAVLHLAALVLGVDAGAADALHAVGALLHDAARAHRDLGVAQHLEGRRLPVLVQQEVEAPHLVGAVVRAVARPHAAVVDHVVQAFVAVHRGRHRADHLAGRVLAVHAENRLVVRLGVLGRALVVAVDADPVHLAAARRPGPSRPPGCCSRTGTR